MNYISSFKYPVVRIEDHIFKFNKACRNIMTSERYRVYTTLDYIIFIPAANSGERSYKFTDDNSLTCKFIIKESMVKQGLYKLYKYKNGAAIKRNEMLFAEGDIP